MTRSPAIYDLPPLEYRVALDAASSWLGAHPPLKLCCAQPALLGEVEMRLSEATPPWKSGLWVEPQVVDWPSQLREFAELLPPAGRLAVLLSLPLAQRLPERKTWQGAGLGEQPGGLRRFRNALEEDGFARQDVYALHSGQAVLLNAAAQLLRRGGRRAAADRLEFAARRVYTLPYQQAWRASVALVLAVRQ